MKTNNPTLIDDLLVIVAFIAIIGGLCLAWRFTPLVTTVAMIIGLKQLAVKWGQSLHAAMAYQLARLL